MTTDPQNLPMNMNGTPEFASVLITLDHLRARDPDEGIHQKMVYSTQYPEDAVFSLFDYYKEPQVKTMPSTSEIISRGFGQRSVYVYVNRHGVVQLAMSTATLRDLIDYAGFGGDSMFMTVNALIAAAEQVLEAGYAAHGGVYPPLSLMQFDFEAVSGGGEAQAGADTSAVSGDPDEMGSMAAGSSAGEPGVFTHTVADNSIEATGDGDTATS